MGNKNKRRQNVSSLFRRKRKQTDQKTAKKDTHLKEQNENKKTINNN